MPWVEGMEWLEGVGHKFDVVKHDDAAKYLTLEERGVLQQLCNKIMIGRLNDKKPGINYYLVINVDESYAEQVADILKEHGHWG